MKQNRLFSDDLEEIIPSEEKMPVMERLAEQMPGGFFSTAPRKREHCCMSTKPSVISSAAKR